MHITSLAALKKFLADKSRGGMSLGLGRIQPAARNLALIPPPFQVVQIVGTNGKGSTGAMLASLAQKHGIKTGLYLSPFFPEIRLNVRIQGVAVPEETWLEAGRFLLKQGGGHSLSYFECITLMAALAFRAAQVDLAIFEAGLGARDDATSVLPADITLVTPISMDHADVLGPSLEAIAHNKLAASPQYTPILSTRQCTGVWSVIREKARQQQALCLQALPAGETSGGGPPARQPAALSDAAACIPLIRHRSNEPEETAIHSAALFSVGGHQHDNAALALAAWRLIKSRNFLTEQGSKTLSVSQNSPETMFRTRLSTPVTDREREALLSAFLPGRFQYACPQPPSLSGKERICMQQSTFPDDSCRAAKTDTLFSRKIILSRESEQGHFPCPAGWPPLVIDGAHNAASLAALGLTLARRKTAPLAVIFSCLEDKGWRDFLPHVRSFSTGIIFVPPVQNAPRPSADPEEVAALLGVNAYPVASLAEGLCFAANSMLERMPEVFEQRECHHPLLICGSLYLLNELYEINPALLTGE